MTIGASASASCAGGRAHVAGKYDTSEGRNAITTAELASIVIHGLAKERFMISTHPWVPDKFAAKARDDEYIATMRASRPAELAKAAAV